jgi:hypothetical protein
MSLVRLLAEELKITYEQGYANASVRSVTEPVWGASMDSRARSSADSANS